MKPKLSKENVIKYILLAAASFSVFIIFLIFIYLFQRSIPAFEELGWSILSREYSPASGRYGLGGAIAGSLLVTAGALIISYPLGIGGGIFLSEIAPVWVRRMLKPIIEVLAGIPSVIYGFLGAVLLVPFAYNAFDMLQGQSYFAGGIILGVMTLPIIISISDDSLKAVPRDIKDASLALGATRWITTKKITFPAASSGIFAAATLGVGKAIGETMAVLMIISATTNAPLPWFDFFQAGPTLTALIAGHMGEAAPGIARSTLFAAGVFLFLIVGTLGIITDVMQQRVIKKFKGR